ncbi:family 16 glycosylhydrolase [Kitasatospora sp. NPDC088783]|uniref:glycoside hydrolase family 16 protein n=1 Tax=Kitasatospora sp. NPDC088783 TaxID=3364077 RepID=UPI00381D2BB1
MTAGPVTRLRRRTLAGTVGLATALGLLTAVGPAAATAGATGAPCADPAGVSYPLPCLRQVFADDFDGTALDPAKWNVRQTSWSNDSNVSVSGGELNIDMKRVSASAGKDGFRGGGISSRQRFGYGYYEITATLPQLTPGWHPAFWTQLWDGAEGRPVYDRPFTELDVFEVQSVAPHGTVPATTKLDGGVITWNNNTSGNDIKNSEFKPRFPWKKADGTPLWNEQHRYGLYYTPTALTYVLDGTPIGTVPNPVRDPMPGTASYPAASYNSPMSIWISAVLTTPAYIGADVPVGTSFGTYRVDRVAYYAPDGQVPPVDDPTPLPDAFTTVAEDFADGAARWWKKPGSTWTTVPAGTGHGLRHPSAQGDAIALLGQPVTDPQPPNTLPFAPDWTNVAVEATVTLDGAGQGAGLMARAKDDQNYYYLQLLPAKQQVALVRKADGVSTVLATAPAASTPGTAYRLKLTVEDNTLTGYVDGVRKLAKDDFAFGTGRIGLKGYQQAFTASDLTVTALG